MCFYTHMRDRFKLWCPLYDNCFLSLVQDTKNSLFDDKRLD